MVRTNLGPIRADVDAAWDLVKDWDAPTRETLRIAAADQALDARVENIHMHELARRTVEIAEAGLKARACTGAGGMIKWYENLGV